jgi:HSP20 family protein
MAEKERKTDSSNSNWFGTGDLFTQSAIPGTYGRFLTRSHIWRPSTDVFEVDDRVIVRVEVAGMRDSDFSITVKDKLLVVRGFRQDLSEKRAYHQMEIPFGEFSSEVELPFPVVIDDAKAEYRNGFLVITLPMEKPRQIQISG